MRELIIEFEPNEMMRKECKPIFEVVRYYEILETLKIEWEHGICVDLIEFSLQDHLSIEDVDHIGDMEILSVLRSEGGKHTCLIKHKEPEGSVDMFREFDLDLIFSQPFIMAPDKCTFSVIGEQKSLNRFVELMKGQASRIINMTLKKAAYRRKDILSVLTEKQKNIIIAARKYGYYDYPKKISSEKLSKRLNITKGTMLEHLRKAEGRLLAEILAGYS